MVDVLEQRTRQPEYIEKRAEQLLTSVYGDPSAVQKEGESAEDFELRKFGRAGVSQPIPAFQFAGFTPEQKQAFQLASSGIGAYAPYLQQAGAAGALGLGSTGLGLGSTALGGGALTAAMPQITGATQGFTPTAATMQATTQAIAKLLLTFIPRLRVTWWSSAVALIAKPYLLR